MEGKPVARGACQQFGEYLVQHPLSFQCIDFGFFLADEGSRPLMRFEHTADLQLAVGSDDSIGIDREIDGQLTDRRELIARLQISPSNRELHLLDDLPVERHSAFRIDAQIHYQRVSQRLSELFI